MKNLLIKLIINVLSINKYILTRNSKLAKLMFLSGLEKTRWNIGKMKVYLEYLKAKKSVPAYKAYINLNGNNKINIEGLVPSIADIPETSKESYVKKYSIDERCNKGSMNVKGVVVDESSGSSGTPSNWVRGLKERKANKRALQLSYKTLFGKEDVFFINAFAMGAWATGVNVTMAFADISIIKSTGPDLEKIVNTLKQFGKKQNYVLFGYPPFLKLLVDEAGIDFREYNISFIFGGESMSENMRTYLLNKGINKVISSYGASDLELNMGYENDTTISIRKLITTNKKFAKKLLKFEGAIPMIFQYNPMDYYIENNENGELIISIARDGYLAPKIRYNIEDRGHVVRNKEMRQLLKECDIDPTTIEGWNNDLPFLFHYGRANSTINYFGANLYPMDLQEAIYSIPELASKCSSYAFKTYEDKNINKQLEIYIEVMDKLSIKNIKSLTDNLINALVKSNQDFKEAIRIMPLKSYPKLVFLNKAEGVFANNDIRIKANYFH